MTTINGFKVVIELTTIYGAKITEVVMVEGTIGFIARAAALRSIDAAYSSCRNRVWSSCEQGTFTFQSNGVGEAGVYFTSLEESVGQ